MNFVFYLFALIVFASMQCGMTFAGTTNGSSLPYGMPVNADNYVHERSDTTIDNSDRYKTINPEIGCHFNLENAVMCRSVGNAASTYNIYGLDFDKTRTSYNLSFLHAHMCSAISMDRAGLAAIPVKAAAYGKFATPYGWIKVVQIFFYWPKDKTGTCIEEGPQKGWCGGYIIDARYLTGTCETFERPKPETGSLRTNIGPSGFQQ